MIKRLAFATCCSLSPVVAMAQSALPSAAEPGALQREMLDRQTRPKAQRQITIPAAGGQVVPAGAEKLRLTLQGLDLTGHTAFTTEELAALYAPYIGQELTLAEVYGLAQQIADHYTRAGYLFTSVTLPPQEIKGGVVKMVISEAYIADFNVIGDDVSPALMTQFKARALAQRPLRKADLEEILRLLADLPGARVTPVLLPSVAPGAVQLDIALAVQAVKGTVGLHNRGSRYTGPFRQNASVTLNNLPHMASVRVTEETALPVEEMRVLDVVYTLPLDAYGNSLTAEVLVSRARPGYTLNPLAVVSESDTFRFGWSRPLQLTAVEDTRLSLSFEHTNAASTLLGGPNADDRLRVFEAAVSHQVQHDDGGNTAARVALRQGVNALGASRPGRPYLSRADGRSQFTTLGFDVEHWQPLDDAWAMHVGLTGQYAGAQLLASEEFAWGGSRFGRGYDTAEFTGDHGLGASVEVNRLLPGVPGAPARHQVYGFADAGRAWRIEANGGDGHTSGVSAGVGLRAFFGEGLTAQLEVAKPLTRPSNSASLHGNDPRVFFSLNFRY